MLRSLLSPDRQEEQPNRVKYWEIIADRLSKSGWSWGCVAVVNTEGRGIARDSFHARASLMRFDHSA
jgi:hypothetical protein